MGEKRAHKKLRAAAETYKFFHEENNSQIEVWAKLLDNYIEDDLYGEDNTVFKIEVNTDAMIEYEAPFFTDSKFDDYNPVLYTFTSIISNSEDKPNLVKEFKKAKGGYVRCLLQRLDRVTTPDHLKGYITIGAQLKFDDASDHILCRSTPVALTIVATENISLNANNTLTTLNTMNGISREMQYTPNAKLPYSTKQPYNRMILPGDVSSYCWPRDINELALDNDLTKLLVPHHGGEVYTYKPFNNTALYKSVYVSRDGSYVPITNNVNLPYVKNEHRKYLEDGMHVYAHNFLYTEHISSTSRPYYTITINPESTI